ncbi:CsxC family protein [Bacillus proteolyticus]|uniref:CsxC family protein n=1 Tax=Bacillus proteolyticus TaxID=2026192 RepID=UPI003D050F23
MRLFSLSEQQSSGPCTDGVTSTEQIPLNVSPITLTPVTTPKSPIIKVPVVLAESTLQIVVESNITLNPAATEIKRVKKNVFLDQVKFVPVEFTPVGTNTNLFKITRAKLFVAGHIRKNIEYASSACNGALQDRIADVKFSGFAEITDFLTPPLLSISTSSETNFVSDTGLNARLDKAFFQNLVQYNEQPFGELVAANFFELDFLLIAATPEGTFDSLTEKIVLDLTLKVLQIQQIQVTGTQVVSTLTGFTPPCF